jgi:hypothetical protein
MEEPASFQILEFIDKVTKEKSGVASPVQKKS